MKDGKLVCVFDLDGTISVAPEILGQMMMSLKSCGHTVYVLTGALSPDDPGGTVEARETQLERLGVHQGIHYDNVTVAIGADLTAVAHIKGEFCYKMGADFIVDDNKLFMWGVATKSPRTLRLKVD